MKLVIHPLTEQQMDAFAKSPSHAVMLVGPDGSGKLSLATRLVESVLDITNATAYPYGTVISASPGKAIGIEAARALEKTMTLKVPGDKAHNRFVIIEDAHLLTLEAQNALLKTLEEPPAGTLLILTVSHPQALLPTIRSRAQMINVGRPDKTALEAHFSDHGPAEVKQAYAISGGLPGLMHNLLNDEEHPLVQATAKARQLLSQTAYERLLSVDELAKQKELAADVTFILQQMAHVSLQSATGAAAKKWQNVLQASYQASEALANGGQPKLALSNLMLNL